MQDFEEPKVAKLINSIEHQGIGGKTIIIEKYGTINYALDMPFETMTIALFNFVNRRNLLDVDPNMKLYYGHVGGLGYFVAEDEIDGEIKDSSWKEVYDTYGKY